MFQIISWKTQFNENMKSTLDLSSSHCTPHSDANKSYKSQDDFHHTTPEIQKSNNLQYNTLGCWVDRLINQQWVAGSDLGHSKLFVFIFVKLWKNWKDFCKEFCKKLWQKNNTWNIRRLVEESFFSTNQGISILYCRLSAFKSLLS